MRYIFLEQSIKNVDEDWPIRNAPFVHNRIISDPENLFSQYKEQIDQLEPKVFEDAFREVINHAFEYLGKVKNNSNPERTMEAARRFTDMLCKATAIKNRYIYKDYCNPYPEIRSLPWAPKSLVDNMEGMAGFRQWDINKIVKTSQSVWEQYLIEAGITPVHENEHKQLSTFSNDSKEYTLRQIGKDDWQVYKELRLKALKENPSFFMKKYFDEVSKSKKAWQEEISPDGGIVIGAFYEGSLIGVTSLLKGQSPATKGYAISTGSYVENEHRKSGVFKALAETVISWAEENKAFKGIVGSHRDGNLPIENVMKLYGFELSGKQMVDWADGKKAYEFMYKKSFKR